MGSFIGKCLNNIEEILEFAAKYAVGKDLPSYCHLNTAIGLTDEDIARHPDLKSPYTLVTDQNSLVSCFEIQGCYEILSDEQFEEVVKNLRLKLNGYMRTYGHSLTFSFERDPNRAFDELMRLAEPQLKTAKRIGLNTEDIVISRIKRNSPLVAWEQNLLFVYTHTSVFSKEEIRHLNTERAKAMAKHKMPKINYGQNPAVYFSAMKMMHDTFIERIQTDFERSGIEGRKGVMLQLLSGHEAVKRIKIMTNRERTSQKYKPVLPGDRIIPRGREDKADYSDLVPPKLSYQICTQNIETEKEFIKSDNLVHGNLSMELGPQEPMPFTELFKSIRRDIPWRITFDITPCGLDQMKLKSVSLAFVGMLPSNKLIKKSFDDLKVKDKEDAVCSMKVTMSTWSGDLNQTKRNLADLEKSIQVWGVCSATSIHGDPVAIWAASIPGFTCKNPANRLVPPLTDALYMTPLQRPANPWGGEGNTILRTPDGKIFPIQQGSQIQDAWIELYAATMGGGKSVLLNVMNFATIHSAGNVRLPLMTIIDKGPSSLGLIQMVRDHLPENRQNEAIYLLLENNKQFASNQFDTQLGLRYPDSFQKSYLDSFFTLICADPITRSAPRETLDLISAAINIAYKDKAEINLNLYEETISEKVDKAIKQGRLREKKGDAWWSDATWWELVDLLFDEGFIQEAILAQRLAVPVLADLIRAIKHASIQDTFSTAKTDHGEPLINYVERRLRSAMNTYALFAGVTRFEIGSETRIVSLDIQNVMGDETPEGKLRTAVVYMFGRQLAAKNFFINEDNFLPLVSNRYLEYHKKRVQDIQNEMKIMAYDEFHNTGGQEEIVNALIRDAREGRKWGIRIAVISQLLEDFPKPLRSVASNIYVLKGGVLSDEEILSNEYKVSKDTIRLLRREATGPTSEGANFLAIFITKKGPVIQMLTNTIGPIEMWAFSTTKEDVAVRNKLYKLIGPIAARQLLAIRFPSGTARPELQRMRDESGDYEEVSVIERLVSKLELEYKALAV
ncbi:hypothetical protein KCM76_22265 [Zooshikella marina]|uniref:hypothetical protein n=1 Tax=Zooshikella ganghwensis TaxID=202772 RepID=UPI001BB02DD1|nr:hypothetical protein [Zooshikella ganghwensis]MBU2708734.1 hypothetical protein [Zooshikella ganghwensis]